MKAQLTRSTTLRELIAEENELRDSAEKLDENKIATEIYITAGSEEFGRNIFVDLDDGNVFSQDPSVSCSKDEAVHFVGKAVGEFSGAWDCPAHYENLVDEDGDEYDGDFIGYSADDGETFEAWIRENGLDANAIDAILDREVEVY